ncbi:unnamed protein product [Withania somnifera]
MDDKKKKKPDEVMEVEFKISMYCEGCEKKFAKTISKIKGDIQLKQNPREIADALIIEYAGDSMLYTMFSDENANACSIM